MYTVLAVWAMCNWTIRLVQNLWAWNKQNMVTCLLSTSSFVWFVFLNYYVFSDAAEACSLENWTALGDVDKSVQERWADAYSFYYYFAVIIWWALGLITGLVCFGVCVFALCAKKNKA